MEAMTLEPIAALHVLIPESMRRLNVVLVDIGAGTSDIAITDKGTVVAYGMVPVAGDEITEAISDQYLLDFPMAEKVKRKIVLEGEAEVEDILGFKTDVTYDMLVEDLQEQIESLSQSIAKEIISLNSKSPRAVMLVGGGSLTPEITKKLALKLGLPANRVAVRGVEAIQQMKSNEKLPKGPEFVTPIGIAITAKERPVQYVSVTVNEQIVRLFEMEKLTVGDCLVQAGYEINRMYGRPGMAAIVTVNSKDITIPGEFGTAPEISLNEKITTVNDIIHNGDQIQIQKGNDGIPASLTLAELIGDSNLIQIYFKSKPYTIGFSYLVNNVVRLDDYIIQDRDIINWRKLETIQDFFGVYLLGEPFKNEFPIIVNQKEIQLPSATTKMHVNGKEVSENYVLRDQDNISILPAIDPTVDDLFKELEYSFWQTMDITFNDERIKLEQPAYSVQRLKESLDIESSLRVNDRIKITEKKAPPFTFQHVFRFVDIDLMNATGKFNLYCNEEKAAFDTIINHGDRLAIIWDE